MINIAFFSIKSYDEQAFKLAKADRDFQYHFFDFQLTEKTAKLAKGCEVVYGFVNDDLSKPELGSSLYCESTSQGCLSLPVSLATQNA